MSPSGGRGTDDGPRWIRHQPSRAEARTSRLVALAAGLVVGAAVLYLGRLLAPRERLEPLRGRRGGGHTKGKTEGAAT